MLNSRKKNDKRFENDGKRPNFSFKRLFLPVEVLPFPGKIWHHLVAISLFIGFEFIVIRTNGDIYPWLHYLPFYIETILLFYFYAHIWYPVIITHKNSWLIIIFTIIFCICISMAFTLTINHTSRYFLTGELSLRTHTQTLANALWRALSIMMMSAVYWFVFHMREQSRKELAMVKMQNKQEFRLKELEIANANSRINQHFLFNTLQFIYVQVERVSDKAEMAVSNLAEFMRYSLTPLQTDFKVFLEDEIRILDILIESTRLHHGPQLNLHYEKEFDDAALKQRIPPHTLLTIAENMNKHGILTDPVTPARLKIVCKGSTLVVTTSNRLPQWPLTGTSGIGLPNLMILLDYAYPDNYHLQLQSDVEIFTLTLKINL